MSATIMRTGTIMVKTNIGLDVKAPEGKCEDRKCPWHGQLPVRGRVFEATVKSSKAKNTAVVEWSHNLYLPKYERFERRKNSVGAYNPICIHAKDGDKVIIAECRPLSKTKSFVVVGFAA